MLRVDSGGMGPAHAKYELLFQTTSPQRFLGVPCSSAVGSQNYMHPDLKGNSDLPESSTNSPTHER